MSTTQYVVATAFSMIVFVLLANLVVDLYARGVVRAAVDEAARTGARLDSSPAECAARARDVLGDLMGPRMRSGVDVTCADGFGVVVARAEVRLPAWLALIPDWSFTLAGTAVKERDR
jgi:hypothetical protein